jgi:hypothetical protein
MPRTRPRLLVGALLPLLLVAGGAGWTTSHATRSKAIAVRTSLWPPFFAAGDSAANIPLATRSERVLIRWVARRTGTVDALQLQVKVTGRGYAAGAGGVLQATTYPVLPNGRPNISAPLARDRFPTRSRERGGAVAVRLDLPVNAGDQFATVVRNDAERPSRDFFSANFLYAKNGVRGANGRNELSVSAGDRYYGLDARELVGYSRDGGATWLLPGGPYGSNGGTDFLPTYVQQYSNGVALGQYYYYAHRVSGRVRMVYPHTPRTTITHIAAYTGNDGAATVVLAVNGQRRASVRLSGAGFLLHRINPVSVPAGATVALTTRAGPGGLSLSQQFADSRWAHLVGLGRRHDWYLDDDPEAAVPLFPLPAWGTS